MLTKPEWRFLHSEIAKERDPPPMSKADLIAHKIDAGECVVRKKNKPKLGVIEAIFDMADATDFKTSESVSIFGVSYGVNLIDSKSSGFGFALEEDSYRQIFISRRLADDHKKCVFVHEILELHLQQEHNISQNLAHDIAQKQEMKFIKSRKILPLPATF